MKADTIFGKDTASLHRRCKRCMPQDGHNTDEVPFDLYGDLEDAYDEADRDGDVEITETLDTFGLWEESPRCSRSWMYKIWCALRGDVVAQADVGHAFYWSDHDPDDVREKYKWLDKPELAIYWYGLAAEAGYADAQSDLACLYCPDLIPYDNKFKLGRFARRWWEEAAAQRLPCGMLGLAKCLRCGKCCCCDRNIPRAKALEAEADEIERRRELNQAREKYSRK